MVIDQPEQKALGETIIKYNLKGRCPHGICVPDSPIEKFAFLGHISPLLRGQQLHTYIQHDVHTPYFCLVWSHLIISPAHAPKKF